MKRKGFTLIELLAVIVILAIIAVIATPIIVGIIEDSKKAAFERSVEGIMHALDLDFGMQESLDNNSYTISNGTIDNIDIPVKNIEGFNGTIKYDEKGHSMYAIHNDKWCMIKDSSGNITKKDYIEGECEINENTSIDCFTFNDIAIDDTEGLIITSYSDTCPKSVIIPAYNGETKYNELDIYEITDIAINMTKCKTNYLNNKEGATEEAATTKCEQEATVFSSDLKNTYLEILNYSKIVRDSILTDDIYDIVYGENKVKEKYIKEYTYNSTKCVNNLILGGTPEEQAASICNSISSEISSYTVEEINEHLNTASSSTSAIFMVGDYVYGYNGTEAKQILAISDNAFKNKQLTSVDIPTSIISIEDASFVGNNLNNESIEKISLINNIALYTPCDDSCFTYQDIEGGIEITDYDETCPREVVIPSKIENKNVVTIGEQSLYYNYSLSSIYGVGYQGDITSVVIPNTVTTIKALAFTGNQISNVVFGSGLITIENGILQSNELSGTLDLSNLKKLEKIDFRAFSSNQLTGAIIPSNVTYIGCSVFGGNDTSFSGTYNGTTFDQDYNPCGAS